MSANQVGSSLAELLSALSFVSDTGMGQQLEHGLKTAYIGLSLAERVGASHEEQTAVYYGALLKDAGCTACGMVLATFFDGDDIEMRSDSLLMRPDSTLNAIRWFWRHAPSDSALPLRVGRLFSFMTQCRSVMAEGVAAHCEVGEMFARQLGLPESVQHAIRFSRERWDGKGIAYSRRGPDTPLAARVLHLAQVVAAAHAFGGASAGRAIAEERKWSAFDPALVGPFLELSRPAGFWRVPDGESAQESVLAMKPDCDFDQLDDSQLESACELLADFADVKSRSTWNHSLLVAEATVAVARQLGLPLPEVKRLRRAALVHDLGKAAVPVGILDKTEPLTPNEADHFRLHPYYTERALTRVEPLRDLAEDAATHHEQPDGLGYYRQLRNGQLPLGGRIIAVADRFTLLSRAAPEADPAWTLNAMRAFAGRELDTDCYEALVAAQTGEPPARAPRPHNPGHLTNREVEVLRLVSDGCTNRQIATTLVLSAKTVEHHMEHIFNKLGVTSRTAAGVFAVQNGLAP